MQTNQRMKDISEMESLIKELNQASAAYYNQDKELISNFEYDQLYDRLAAWKKDMESFLLEARRRMWDFL